MHRAVYGGGAMKMLLINTCGGEGVVALAEGDAVLAEEKLPGRGTSEHLMPAIRGLFGGQGWRGGEVGAVGVVDGPGSFTGVRVGLSAAKGLCEAVGVGMIALSRLGLIAAEVESAGEVVGVLDGGRGEYYCGVYRQGAKLVEALMSAEEVRRRLATGVGVTCEERVALMMQELRVVPEPGAETMLRMARRRVAAGAWSDVAAADANYLRRTDAELLVRRG